jgi:hypothetical protein
VNSQEKLGNKEQSEIEEQQPSIEEQQPSIEEPQPSIEEPKQPRAERKKRLNPFQKDIEWLSSLFGR